MFFRPKSFYSNDDSIPVYMTFETETPPDFKNDDDAFKKISLGYPVFLYNDAADHWDEKHTQLGYPNWEVRVELLVPSNELKLISKKQHGPRPQDSYLVFNLKNELRFYPQDIIESVTLKRWGPIDLDLKQPEPKLEKQEYKNHKRHTPVDCTTRVAQTVKMVYEDVGQLLRMR